MSSNNSISGKRKAGTVLFSVFAVILFLVATVFYGFKYVVSKEGIKEIIVNADLEKAGITREISDSVYNGLPKDTIEQYDISQEDIDKAFENKDIKNYVGEVVGEATEYAIYGTGEKSSFDPEKLTGILRDNPEVVQDITGEAPTEETFTKIQKDFTDMNKEMDGYVDGIKDNKEYADFSKYRAALSDWWVVAFTAIGIFSIVLIYLVSKKKIAFTLSVTGIISIIYALITFGVKSSINNAKIEGNQEIIKPLLDIFATKISTGITIAGILGVTEIVIAYILTKRNAPSKEM